MCSWSPDRGTGDQLIDSTSLDALLHTSPYSHFPLVEIRRHPVESLEEVSGLFEDREHVIDLAIVPFLFSGRADIGIEFNSEGLATQSADPVVVRPPDARTEPEEPDH